MIRTLDGLLGYAIHAQDGDLGKVHDFYFDDDTWTVRWIVVETGGWLRRKRVLISPVALEGHDWNNRKIPVKLTKEQVAKAPNVDTDRPVSRQHELSMNLHYGWPPYWMMEPFLLTHAGALKASVLTGEGGDPHLRSFREVSSYHVEISGEHVGFVEDMLLDDENLQIRSIVVLRGEWIPRGSVVVDRHGVRRISWVSKLVELQSGVLDAPVEFNAKRA